MLQSIEGWTHKLGNNMHRVRRFERIALRRNNEFYYVASVVSIVCYYVSSIFCACGNLWSHAHLNNIWFVRCCNWRFFSKAQLNQLQVMFYYFTLLTYN